MSLFHRHDWTILTYAYVKDYFHNYNYTYEDDKGISREWGKPTTVFTQECTICHKLREFTVNGYQKFATPAKSRSGKGEI